MTIQEEYKINYKKMWFSYMEEQRQNPDNQFIKYWIERLKSDIKWRIDKLNDNNITNDNILHFTNEVEVLIECLNYYDDTLIEHETFTGILDGQNKYCEWDKKYHYEFLTPSEKSTNYNFIRVFDNWENHQINCNKVKSYLVDHVGNILNLEV